MLIKWLESSRKKYDKYLQLNNLILIIDYNKIQALSKLKDALPLHNLSKKIKSFNWNCIEVKNGHSLIELKSKFSKKINNSKPTAIIVHTIKGKGIKEFENDPSWHARKLQGIDLQIGKFALGIKWEEDLEKLLAT